MYRLIVIIFIQLGFITNIFSQTKSNNNTDNFIHTTYCVGGSLKDLEIINNSDYDNFQFIYLMATPQWNELDFNMPVENIINSAQTYHYSNTHHFRNVPEMMSKAQNSNTKVLISFAGEGFNPLVEDSIRRNKFVQYMVTFMRTNHFDGIEIDWETGIDLKVHAKLMEDIRTELNKWELHDNKKYYLTTALHYFHKYNKELAERLEKNIDWINIMTYDMGGGIWGKKASHNTPFNEIKKALKNWKSVFDPNMLCIGLANYGFIYKYILPEEEVKSSLNQYGKYIGYNHFLKLKNEGWSEQYDPEEDVSYYISPDKNLFVTMENETSILNKIKWIRQENFKGAFWWEFHYDFVNEDGETKHHLIDVVTKYLKQY